MFKHILQRPKVPIFIRNGNFKGIAFDKSAEEKRMKKEVKEILRKSFLWVHQDQFLNNG